MKHTHAHARAQTHANKKHYIKITKITNTFSYVNYQKH